MKKNLLLGLVVLSIIGIFAISYVVYPKTTAQETLPSIEEQQATLSARNDELDKRLQSLEFEKQGIELEKRINSLKWESLEVQKRVRDNISEGL